MLSRANILTMQQSHHDRSKVASGHVNHAHMSGIHHYGSSPSQILRILYPSTCAGSYPVAIILHGGFWKSKYGINPPTAACETLAPDLRDHHFVVVEVEYRRDRDEQWGWPYTNTDVSEAYRVATSLPYIDRKRIIVIGHSAGGTLALWLAAHLWRNHSEVLMRHVFALAPVANLREAVNLRLSDEGDAVIRYMHGKPSELSSQYDEACPTCAAADLVRLNITLVAGENDNDVPLSIIESLHQAIDEAATKGSCTERGYLELVTLPNTDHYDLVNARAIAWEAVRARILNSSARNTTESRSAE